MAFDVAERTHELQAQFKTFASDMTREELAAGAQNKATPANIKILLDDLAKITDDLMSKRDEIVDHEIDPSSWDEDMAKWNDRLAYYQTEVEAAAPDDRMGILWSVTAPLLVGYYGGPDSKLPQSVIDAVTPFILANGLEVADQWQHENWNRLIQDIKDRIKEVGLDIGMIVLAAVGAAVGAAILFNVVTSLGKR